MMSQLPEEDPEYCQWAVQLPDPSPEMQKIADYVKKHAPEVADAEPVINLKKYRGTGATIPELVEMDPGYLEWIVRTAQGNDPGAAMLKIAQYLAKHYPDLVARALADGEDKYM